MYASLERYADVFCACYCCPVVGCRLRAEERPAQPGGHTACFERIPGQETGAVRSGDEHRSSERSIPGRDGRSRGAVSKQDEPRGEHDHDLRAEAYWSGHVAGARAEIGRRRRSAFRDAEARGAYALAVGSPNPSNLGGPGTTVPGAAPANPHGMQQAPANPHGQQAPGATGPATEQPKSSHPKSGK